MNTNNYNCQTCGKIFETRAVIYSPDTSIISVLDLLQFKIVQEVKINNFYQIESLNLLMARNLDDFIIAAHGHSDKDINLLFTIHVDTKIDYEIY